MANIHYSRIFVTIQPMRLWGKVRKGKGRGKRLGFKTANFLLRRKIAEGVYISKTKIEGKELPSLSFVGPAKTFGETKPQVETYILDFDRLIVGSWISVKLLKKIRGNKKFSSKQELIQKMKEDEKIARKYF